MSSIIQILLYGLEESGKSTIITSFQEGLFTSGIPFTAQKFYDITIESNLNFNIVEVGGGKHVRSVVPKFIEHVDAIIFVIDGSNEANLSEIESEFKKILYHPSSLAKPLAILFNKKDIATFHPSVIIERLDILNRFDRPHRVFSTTAKEPHSFKQVLQWINDRLTEDDIPIEDQKSRFMTIYILDILNTHNKGLPLLSVLGQLEIISRTGQVEYNRDKIMTLLRKLLSTGEIELIDEPPIYKITKKGLERLESSELIKGSRYEELRMLLDKSKEEVNSSGTKKIGLDKDEKEFIDEFDIDELAELYKKTSSRKRQNL